jgi:four helix bundle protein
MGEANTIGKRSSVQRFEDLKVWQAARELVRGVYRATRTQKLKSDRGLVAQMTDSAVSITSNIAEGYERGSRVQNIQFCFYAKGSAGELRSQVINAHDVELLDETAFKWLHERSLEVSAMLAGYIKHLSESAPRIRGMRYTHDCDRTQLSDEHGFGEAQEPPSVMIRERKRGVRRR